MNNLLMQRLKSWRKHHNKPHLGIYIAPDAVWVYQQGIENKELAEKCFPYQGNDWQQVFATIIGHFGQVQLNIVLSASWYQLFIVDKPNVAKEEMSQAIIWAAKDLTTIELQDLHLDYYDTPVAGRNKISLVIANKSQLKPLVSAITSLGCSINGISIEQMALCAIASEKDNSQLILSHYPQQEALFTITKGGLLFMQRRLRGFRNLDQFTVSELPQIVDKLTLELQRSMDFFESQLRQPPVNRILLLTDGASNELANLLNNNFNQPISAIQRSSVGAKMALLTEQIFDEVLL